MKVEFLVDKSDYKKLLSGISFVAKNGITVKNDSDKIKGKTNYVFTLSCDKNNISSAKALSEMRIVVEKILHDKDIKFRVLIDEALQFFATSLYPLACDFEIKLRSLIYMVIFDIDEQANAMAVDKFNKVIKTDNKMSELPKNDFLSQLTFEVIFNFLFDNNSFIDAAKAIVSQTGKVYNRRMTKAEILKSIEAAEEQTIWNVIFAPLFPKSVIPKIYEDIHKYRNMIMHVRDIDYTNYDIIKRTYKSGIKDLDQNLSTGLVADDSKDNIGLLAQTLVNSYYLYRQVYNARKALDVLYNDEMRATLDRVRDMQDHIVDLMKPISASYFETSNKVAALQRKLGTIYVDPDLLDKIEALQRQVTSHVVKDILSDTEVIDQSNDSDNDPTDE